MTTRSFGIRCIECVARRSLATVTPTRSCPRLPISLPPRRVWTTEHQRHHKSAKTFFSSDRLLRKQDALHLNHWEPTKKTQKRKATRAQAAGTSLRKAAVAAQQLRDGILGGSGKGRSVDPGMATKEITAYCVAEQYNISLAKHYLREEGFKADPFSTGLYPQVLHVQTPNYVDNNAEQGVGDVFVFPSGCVVTWNVPYRLAQSIVNRILLPAAEGSLGDDSEAEDLEYVEDPTKDSSSILGETIILGTAQPSEVHYVREVGQTAEQRHEVDKILAKIAFSSGLARSTKLAVLENSLTNYFNTTKSIPLTLSRGSKLRFTRDFILRKTGELLSIRAQLNLYSELTDSLPDLFWDSPHSLGLEGYYDDAGKALDVGVRIKVLNEKMDYASEIAAVLRERLSEKHSTGLEWLIIFLISIEVGFGTWHLWREKREDSTEELLRQFLKARIEENGNGK